MLQELARELLGGGGGGGTPPPPVPTNTMTIALNNSAAHCDGAHGTTLSCCLDVSDWNRAANAAVLASNCHYDPSGFDGKGFLNQRWTIESDGSIKVALDGMCLTAASAESITVSTCKAGEASQKWVAKAGVGPVKTGGKCLMQVHKKGCGDGYTLVACDSSNKLQQWTIELAISPPAPPRPPPPPLTLLSFAAKPDDKIFGFGEHQQGHLDNKGLKYDMESCLVYGKSHGGEVCLPWVLSASSDGKGSFGLEYGFLWNVSYVQRLDVCLACFLLTTRRAWVGGEECIGSRGGERKENRGFMNVSDIEPLRSQMPNYGGVEFGSDFTNWTAQSGTQVDYFVTVAGKAGATASASVGTQIMNSYVDAVGHSPMLPSWGSGYWHSKNRYSTQQQITDAAAGFASRGINVSVIVRHCLCR